MKNIKIRKYAEIFVICFTIWVIHLNLLITFLRFVMFRKGGDIYGTYIR